MAPRVRLISFALALASLASCSDTSTEGGISVRYQDIAEPGFIDQTVALRSDSDKALVPVVRYTALGSDGQAVPGIEVSAVYGSDRGLLVALPLETIDILVFSGEQVAEVVDVAAEVQTLSESSQPVGVVLGEPEPFASGTIVSKFDVFDQVQLTNDGPVDAMVRVVCLNYDQPSPGNAQQAEDVTVVADRIRVPAGDSVRVEVSDQFARRASQLGYGCGSLKAHLTP